MDDDPEGDRTEVKILRNISRKHSKVHGACGPLVVLHDTYTTIVPGVGAHG